MNPQPKQQRTAVWLSVVVVALLAIVATVVLLVQRDPDSDREDASVGDEIFHSVKVLKGSALIGAPIQVAGYDSEDYGYIAFLAVTGDPAEVWTAYQEHLGDVLDASTPEGLEACTSKNPKRGQSVCRLEGAVEIDGETYNVALEMRQPREDFYGNYILELVMSPDSANPPSDAALVPAKKTSDILDEIPDPDSADAEPPKPGEEIGNGLLNNAYDLPLQKGLSVVANLDSGQGVGGITVMLQAESGTDPAAVATKLADHVCEPEPPKVHTEDGVTYTDVICTGYAGDNGGNVVVAELPDGKTFIYFDIYID